MLGARTRDEAGEIVALAIPVVITQLGLASMGAVDSMIVGRLLGKAALGGVSLGSSLFFGVTLLALGTIMAVDPLVAQRVGANERSRCGEYLWRGLWLAVLLSIPFTMLFLDCGWLLTLLLGAKSETDPAKAAELLRTADLAAEYLRGRAWSIPPMLVFAAVRGFLNGVGNTRSTMYVAIAANVANGLLVYGLARHAGADIDLGVIGAGLGTSIATVFMAVALGATLWRGYSVYEIGPRRPDARGLLEVLRFGLPIGGTITAEVGVFTAAAVVMGQIGQDTLAAHQIALQLASLTFMVPLGVSVAASIRVGQAVGARDHDGVRRAGLVAYAIGVGFMVVSASAFFLAPIPLARLFTDAPEVLPLAASLLHIAALFQLSDGAQAVGAGCLRGAGDSRTAFLVNVAAHWGIGFPVGYGLAIRAGWGAPGMWYGLTASLTAVAILLAWRFATARYAPLEDDPKSRGAGDPPGSPAPREDSREPAEAATALPGEGKPLPEPLRLKAPAPAPTGSGPSA